MDAISSVLSIPLPHMGASQSTSVEGVASYAYDMSRAVPLAQRIISVLRCGESYPGELAEETEETMEMVRRIRETINTTAPAPGQEGPGHE